MEQMNYGRKCKAPGFNQFDLNLHEGFDKSERTFQEKMMKIYEKYDRPFEDDIVIHFDSLTYDTPNGRRHQWDFVTNMWDVLQADGMVSDEHNNETKDFEETKVKPSKKTVSISKCQDSSRPVRKHVSCDSPEESPTQRSKRKKLSSTFDVDQFSSNHCTTLMKHKQMNCDEYGRFTSSKNRDSTVINKTLHIEFPFNTTISEQGKRFDMSNRPLEKSPGKYNMAVCQINDSGPSNSDELGNKTLQDFYPEMIESLCKLWNLKIRNQAAGKIVQYYKRHIFCKNKMVSGVKTTNKIVPKPFNQTISFPTSVEEISTASMSYNSTMLQKSSLNRSPFYSSSASSTPCRMYISSPKSITMKSQMLIDTALLSHCKDSKPFEQSIHTLNRRCSLPGYLPLQSPKTLFAKPNCNMNERPMTLAKAVSSPSQMDINERNHANYNEHTKKLQNRTCTLTRRNSFSAFPVAHSTSTEFENLYRSLTHTRPQPEFSLGKTIVHLSKTVSSLVNSPGSVRAKRPLSQDFSFSMSKKPRSVTEAIVGSSKLSRSMDTSDVSWSEPRSIALHQTIVASSLPALMLPPSPLSLRSFSPRVHGRGAEKIKSLNIKKKLIYGDDRTNTGN